MRFITHEELKGKGIRYSKPHIWRLRKLPITDPRKFPDPVKGLGPQNSYDEDEIDRYVEAQVAARDSAEVT